MLHFISRQGKPFVTQEPWVDMPSSLSPLLLRYSRPERFLGPLWLDTAPFADDPLLAEFRPAAVTQAPVPAPVDSPAISRLVNPFFYADRQDPDVPGTPLTQHTFFVQPRLTAATWVEYEGTFVPATTTSPHTPASVAATELEATVPATTRVLATGQVVVAPPEPVDASAPFALRRPADWVAGTDAAIRVGARVVDAAGQTPATTGAPPQS